MTALLLVLGVSALLGLLLLRWQFPAHYRYRSGQVGDGVVIRARPAAPKEASSGHSMTPALQTISHPDLWHLPPPHVFPGSPTASLHSDMSTMRDTSNSPAFWLLISVTSPPVTQARPLGRLPPHYPVWSCHSTS